MFSRIKGTPSVLAVFLLDFERRSFGVMRCNRTCEYFARNYPSEAGLCETFDVWGLTLHLAVTSAPLVAPLFTVVRHGMLGDLGDFGEESLVGFHP
jgi:hypothetical protein